VKIAIVGATGKVGREALKIICEKKLNVGNDILLFASEKSDGKVINVDQFEFTVKELNDKNLDSQYDYAFFCAGSEISKMYEKTFLNKGAVVIDNSSAFRRVDKVPLVVPEINFDCVENYRLIANPNCSTIGCAMVLFALSKLYEIKRVVVSTYQAVSGAGQKGIDDLTNKTCNKFSYNIDNNLIPCIDKPLTNDYTFEEDKMNFELRKVLQKDIKITTTCVRVPVINCHSACLNIQFDRAPVLQKVKQVLSNFEGICLYDDLKNNKYPMPIVADGKDDVFVGRIRKDTSNTRAINLFICFDNVRKGASLNAVQILERLIKAKAFKNLST